MKIYTCLMLVLFLFLTSCKEKKESDTILIGKYLYQDKGGTIHVSDKCFKLWGSEDNNYGVKRIVSKGFNPQLLNNTCSFCIKDDIYEKLKSMKGTLSIDNDSCQNHCE